MHTFIKFLYSLLIAGAISGFVLLSIYTFYQPPKAPDYNSYSYSGGYSDSQSTAYDNALKAYDAKDKAYQKNISYAEMPLAIIATGLGLLLFKRTEVIGEGIALGGIFVSIGAITAASIGDARIPRFIAALILILNVIAVAYVRFSDKKLPKQHIDSPPAPPQPPQPLQPAI